MPRKSERVPSGTGTTLAPATVAAVEALTDSWAALEADYRETVFVPDGARDARQIAESLHSSLDVARDWIRVRVAGGRLAHGKQFRLDARGHRVLMQVYWPK